MSRKKNPRNINSVGGRLSWAREKKGYNIPMLSEIIRYAGGYLSNVELNKRTPSERFLDTLEEKTGISRAWLLTGEGEMFKAEKYSPQEKEAHQVAEGPNFYAIVEQVSGRCTIVSAEDMEMIHDLLCILKSDDQGIKEAIRANLREFKRLSGFLNAQFGDIIILERRVEIKDYEGEDRRTKKASGQ
jgi:transcriptional regulator with XRE-family HTH domain